MTFVFAESYLFTAISMGGVILCLRDRSFNCGECLFRVVVQTDEFCIFTKLIRFHKRHAVRYGLSLDIPNFLTAVGSE